MTALHGKGEAKDPTNHSQAYSRTYSVRGAGPAASDHPIGAMASTCGDLPEIALHLFTHTLHIFSSAPRRCPSSLYVHDMHDMNTFS